MLYFIVTLGPCYCTLFNLSGVYAVFNFEILAIRGIFIFFFLKKPLSFLRMSLTFLKKHTLYLCIFLLSYKTRIDN